MGPVLKAKGSLIHVDLKKSNVGFPFSVASEKEKEQRIGFDKAESIDGGCAARVWPSEDIK